MSAKNKYIWVLFMGLFTSNSIGQVGINTIDPKAQLDIAISNMDSPESTDGILIPRINNFPTSDPTEDQHGMLVFLNNAKVGFPMGFYYWSGTSKSWKPITENAFSNFYKEGTQLPSKDIDDAIFRNGNVRIGGDENTHENKIKLSVTIKPTETTVKTGLEILNENSAIKRNTYSIHATNNSLTGAIKYGIKNIVSADGEGKHYGIWNEVSQKHNADIYGIYNDVGKTFGANQEHYGIYSVIGTDQGNGTVYGIYSKALSTDEAYAGYFVGRLGIGKTPAEDYVFPATRGQEKQILVSDENGNLKWEFPGRKIYTSTESATGNYEILEETYTLRINDGVTLITIPDANLYRGRILVLVNWSNDYINFNFSSGDNIHDVVTDSNIPGINEDEVLTIQSAGNGWTLIDRM